MHSRSASPWTAIGLGGSAALALMHSDRAAAQIRFTFDKVAYSYTISCSNAPASTDCQPTRSGTFNGQFYYDAGTAGGDIRLDSMTASTSPYILGNKQDWSSVGFATYTGGKVLAQSGTTQTLLLWGGCSNNSNLCDFGVTLTFAGSLAEANNQPTIISFASTGNDNFCNKVNITSSSTTNYCTSQKNNISGLSNQVISTPSPALGLGLLPLARIGWRRRRAESTKPALETGCQ